MRKFNALIVILLALWSTSLLHAAGKPAPLPPGMGQYVVALWPAGAPIPGDPKGKVKDLPEPDFAALGGRVVETKDSRRMIVLPVAAAKALRRNPAVVYLQRVWMGEPLSEWNETNAAEDDDAPVAASGLKPKAEDDTNLQWGPKAYTYDGSGNIKQIGPDQYTYDTSGRLVSATVNGKTESYDYDPFGNLIQHAVTGANPVMSPVDAASNRLLGVSYDAAGNATTAQEGRWTYGYDSFNMLTRVRTDHTNRRMIYDADDEQLGMLNVGDSLTRWTLRDFEGRVIREYKADLIGSTLSFWTWEQDYFHGAGVLLGGDTQTWQYYSTTFGGPRHYHLDHLGSVRMVTDGGHRAISEHEYFPFGVTMTRTYQEEYNWGDPHIDSMRFAGHARDFLGLLNADTTEYLDSMHARYYSPVQGRFLSPDPVIDIEKALPEPQLWNRYAYVTNNPLKYADPNGEERELPYCVRHRCSAAELRERSKAGNQVLYTAAVVGAVLVGPELAAAAFAACLGNPVACTQLIGNAMLPPGASEIPVPEAVIPGPVNSQWGKLDYLLGEVTSGEHAIGSAGKGGFFRGVLGFDHETLGAALKEHFATNLGKAVKNDKGFYELVGTMTGANGRVANVKTVWEKIGKNSYKLITAMPE